MTTELRTSPVAEEDGESILRVGAGDVVVRRAGSGTEMTYLHGMIGTPPAAPILAVAQRTRLAITAPCLPGFTGSEPRAMTRTIHDWVFHLSAILDATGTTGRPVIASSVGAMVAVELAAVRPEAFRHLVLVSPLGLWDETDPIADPYATTLSAQRRLLTNDESVTAPFFDDPDGLEGDELVEHGVARYATRTAAASLVWPIPEHGLAERIHRVTVPVTLIWGGDDRVVPLSYLDRWHAALPNPAGTHVIDGAGHLADWDAPAAVADLARTAIGG